MFSSHVNKVSEPGLSPDIFIPNLIQFPLSNYNFWAVGVSLVTMIQIFRKSDPPWGNICLFPMVPIIMWIWLRVLPIPTEFCLSQFSPCSRALLNTNLNCTFGGDKNNLGAKKHWFCLVPSISVFQSSLRTIFMSSTQQSMKGGINAFFW